MSTEAKVTKHFFLKERESKVRAFIFTSKLFPIRTHKDPQPPSRLSSKLASYSLGTHPKEKKKNFVGLAY
jgi:hypothetical protein